MRSLGSFPVPVSVSVFVTLAIAGSACSQRSERQPSAGSGSDSGSDSGSGSGSAVAPPDPSSSDDAALREHMLAHFAAASELQRAIARGHLDQAQEHAQWLVGHDETLLDGWQPYVDEMRAAATEVANAHDLPTAAGLAARLGRACSRCHEAQLATVAFAWTLPPEDEPVLAAQMKRHQWAAARLWEGLVGPSDEMWSQGATVLRTTNLDSAAAANGAPRGDVAALASRVRELAARATKVTDHDERGRLYGELLSTCAGCHMLVRPNPVP